MDLNLYCKGENIKKPFKINQKTREGLVIKIHNTHQNSKTRIVHTCFNGSGSILVTIDTEGNIFVIDFSSKKFWKILGIKSCTFLKVSSIKAWELYIGSPDGAIKILNLTNGDSAGALLGHESPPKQLCVSRKNFKGLSYSNKDAILWDLHNNTKLQNLILGFYNQPELKFTCFLPHNDDVMACFGDLIQVWRLEDLTFRQEINLRNFKIRVQNVAFIRNGWTMLLSSYTPHLVFIDLLNFETVKTLRLPEIIQSVKHVDFVPQSFDGGHNKILAVLSREGTIYFHNIERNSIVHVLKTEVEIIRFECSPRANTLACILCTGEIEVYNVSKFVKLEKFKKEILKKTNKPIRRNFYDIKSTKQEIQDLLEINKLKLILNEYGEYPEAFRRTIWGMLLQLPKNRELYNSAINRTMNQSIEDMNWKFPLQNRKHLRNLKHLLINLGNWCPFFHQVEYLPNFVFPFVKMFDTSPLDRFEAVCTIIINWCQFWFEYYPLAPLNILGLIENVLLEYDPDLLKYLYKQNITTEDYAWPTLSTVFSEVLTGAEWLIFWDHVLSNEPSFLLLAVVAYSVINRSKIFAIKDKNALKKFYLGQNPLVIKKLIAKTYELLCNTTLQYHPRQYLKPFQKINPVYYPLFTAHPKTSIQQERLLNDSWKFGNAPLEEFDDATIEREQARRLDLVNRLSEHKTEFPHKYQENILKTLQEERKHIYQSLLEKQKDELLDLFSNLVFSEDSQRSSKTSSLEDKKQSDLQLKFRPNLNIASIEEGISVINDVIEKIREELIKPAAESQLLIVQLKSECVELVQNINQLLSLLNNANT